MSQPEVQIRSFTGAYLFLSNFSPAPIQYEEIGYPSVEHAYQAAKTLDPLQRRAIAARPYARQAKRAGRGVTLRPDWDTVKLDVMRTLLAEKFKVGTELAARLRATGDTELVEGNWWGDRFWGVCHGEGENWLGRLLMERRDVLLGRRNA